MDYNRMDKKIKQTMKKEVENEQTSRKEIQHCSVRRDAPMIML